MVPSFRPQIPANGFKLFSDVTAAQLSAGITQHRCLFIQTSTTLTSPLTVFLEATLSASAQTTIAIGVDPAAANTIGAIVATETTAPAGVVFSSPITFGTGLSLGTLTAGQSRALWVRRTISPGATSFQNDFSILAYSTDGGVTNKTLVFWWHLEAGVVFSSVTRDRVGSKLTRSQGCLWTVNTVTSGTTTPADPTGNVVYAQIAATTKDWPSTSPVTLTDTFLARCNKVSTGVYTLQFKPITPGHYKFIFDIGEDESVQDVVVAVA